MSCIHSAALTNYSSCTNMFQHANWLHHEQQLVGNIKARNNNEWKGMFQLTGTDKSHGTQTSYFLWCLIKIRRLYAGTPDERTYLVWDSKWRFIFIADGHPRMTQEWSEQVKNIFVLDRALLHPLRVVGSQNIKQRLVREYTYTLLECGRGKVEDCPWVHLTILILQDSQAVSWAACTIPV